MSVTLNTGTVTGWGPDADPLSTSAPAFRFSLNETKMVLIYPLLSGKRDPVVISKSARARIIQFKSSTELKGLPPDWKMDPSSSDLCWHGRGQLGAWFLQALPCCQVVLDESVPFSFYYDTDGIPKSCRLSGATRLRAKEDSKTADLPFFGKCFSSNETILLKISHLLSTEADVPY